MGSNVGAAAEPSCPSHFSHLLPAVKWDGKSKSNHSNQDIFSLQTICEGYADYYFEGLDTIDQSISSGCLACCSKPKLIPPVKPPPKGFGTKERIIKKPSHSEDFWSSSLYDMENSTVQSQRSISSISTLNHTHDPQAGSGSGRAPEFVNHGLLLWNQTRQQWVGNKRQETRPEQVREPNLSWNVTYEGLLGSNKPFSQPLPLSEMVDFLVDTWEQEGMYD